MRGVQRRLAVMAALLMVVAVPPALGQVPTIKIGFFAPLTGPAAPDGTSSRNGAQMAVDEINAAGGVLGRPLELVVYDDRLQASEAVAIAHRLIERDRVVAVVAGSYSGPTRATAPIFQSAGIPTVAAYAVHPDITKAGDYVFRNSFLGTIQGKAGAHLAARILNAKTASLLVMDIDFGRALASGFRTQAAAYGLRVVSEDTYPLGEKEFAPLLTKIKGLNPDVIYATAYFAEAAQIVRQAKALGITSRIIGQEGYDSPKFLELAGPAAEGVIITTNLNRDDTRPVTKQFLTRYKARFGIDADMVGASSYDAVRIIAAAIEKAGVVSPPRIRDQIYRITNFDGVTGIIRGYNRQGEVLKTVQVQIVREGRFRYFAVIDDPAVITPPTE
ncbi:MAG: ABC transporter substrate-binding protein [Armatimonadota bacterium]|nr:ABC transporter substrate-binding protein [Armatimonadota bacterium]MDR7518954.1 ABC transporter substrate-binding protein [Armatimonadota bacterium]MDR7548575.1 ABC transporter substrate-binding protein [Armatimonadota bacterium]